MAKKYKPSKDAKKHIVKKMQETEGLNTGFGQYKEATGGGVPFKKGDSNTRTTRENGKKREAENPTTKQPRTSDGKFSYKSLNGMPIDPKYGPSRGVTVPPTLTGGVNGIKIDDVEKQFGSKSGAYWDKWKDKWYTKGGKVVTEGLSTKVSAETVWNMAKEYNKDLGEFKGESENWKTKTGIKSQAEKAAIQKAQDSKQQQNVISAKHGGIETLGEAKKKLEKVIESKKQAAPVQEEVKEEVKVEQSKPWGKTGKFNEKQAEIAKANVKKMFGDDADLISDDELEETMASNPEIFESLM